MFQRIISEQPPHDVYVEAFLGGGSIMRRKLPAAENVGIDADGVPISRARAMVDARGWFLGAPSDLAYAARVKFLVGDSIRMLSDWARCRGPLWTRYGHLDDRVLVYCDPPYLPATRRQDRRIYRYELTPADHVRLLGVVQRLPCLVQILGYFSDLYAYALQGWRSISYPTMTRGTTSATEWLWMNYSQPNELYDYRYLGRGFRDRERFRRLRSRMLARLARLPDLERAALLSAMSAAWPTRRK